MAPPARLSGSFRIPDSGPVDDVSGFLLALLLWGWVVLPFLQNGPTGVKNVLRAKFVNKAADGSWLP